MRGGRWDRRLVYFALVMLAAALVWWTSREEAAPPAGHWERPDGRVGALVLPAEAWGPFAHAVLREDPAPAPLPATLEAPGCRLGGEELRLVAAWTPDGWLQVALVAAGSGAGSAPGGGACPALELLLRPGIEGPARAEVRALAAGRTGDRPVLRNLRGRVGLPRLPWDGELPLAVSLRLQGEDASRAPVTLDATFTVTDAHPSAPPPDAPGGPGGSTGR